MLDLIKSIFGFVSDIPKALAEILKFIPNFFELVFSVIDIMPSPLNTITKMAITLISGVFVVKIARGK